MKKIRLITTLFMAFFSMSVIGFSQKTSNQKISDLIKSLHPWDDGYSGCFGEVFNDSTMNALVQIGKPASKQLYSLLDSGGKAIPAHVILSFIYKDKIDRKKTTEKKEQSILKLKITFNGLTWETEINGSTGTSSNSFDQKELAQIKKVWAQRIK